MPSVKKCITSIVKYNYLALLKKNLSSLIYAIYFALARFKITAQSFDKMFKEKQNFQSEMQNFDFSSSPETLTRIHWGWRFYINTIFLKKPFLIKIGDHNYSSESMLKFLAADLVHFSTDPDPGQALENQRIRTRNQSFIEIKEPFFSAIFFIIRYNNYNTSQTYLNIFEMVVSIKWFKVGSKEGSGSYWLKIQWSNLLRILTPDKITYVSD